MSVSAQADSTAANAVFSYALTTQDDPISPGKVASFTLTVTNLTGGAQTPSLTYVVPNFTTSNFTRNGNHSAGTQITLPFSSLPAGATVSEVINLTVLDSGAATPPDGTVIELSLLDPERSTTFSRSITTQNAPAADLRFSTPAGTVAPGGVFSYTLTWHNLGVSTIAGAKLSLAVPAGAGFVSASPGGQLAGGVVSWSLQDLPAGATGEVQVSLTAPAASNGAPLFLDATLQNGAGMAVAHASTTKAIAAAPVFSYALTSADDASAPGQVASFILTVTNLTGGAQTATVNYQVPSYVTSNYTNNGNHSPGTEISIGFGSLPAGATESAVINLTLGSSGTDTPPDGTIIDLSVLDADRGAIVSRSITAKNVPPADLRFSTPAGTVAPGAGFSYSLAYHNASGSTIPDATLSLLVPEGASLVSASGGGAAVGGAVVWSLHDLAAGATGEVQVSFTAPAAATAAPLRLDATLRNGAGAVQAHASTVKTIAAAPVFSYQLTTADDPVAPGQVASFILTVTNLTNGLQGVSLDYQVPQGTTSNLTRNGSRSAGVDVPFSFNNVPAGASQSAVINLTLLSSGAGTLPDGSLIPLSILDADRGAIVSRSVTSRNLPAADLRLATADGTVKPGDPFTYTLAYHNRSGSPIAGAKLSVGVPAGASFFSATAGGAVADGAVQWSLGTLAAGATGQVQATFTAPATAGAPLLIEAALRDGAGTLFAHSSTVKALAAAPVFSYQLTTSDDLLKPGLAAVFTLTVTNLTNGTQSTSLDYQVPNGTTSNFTRNGSNSAGVDVPLGFSNVPAFGSQSEVIKLTALNSGAATPPDGTLIDLSLIDEDRGAIFSRIVTIQSAPPATQVIALAGNLVFGTVKVGTTATKTLTISNTGNSPFTVSSVNYPAGFSGDYNGGAIAAGASQSVTVTFAPVAVGDFGGTLTVNSNAAAGTNTIAVSGTGAAHPPPTSFTAVAGVYQGVAETGTGALSLTLDKHGVATGKVLVDGSVHNFHGKFDSNGHFTGTVRPPLNLTLQVDLTATAGTPGALVITGAAGEAVFSIHHRVASSVDVAGRYTVRLNAGADAVAAPLGTSFAVVNANRTGTVRLAGRLADGKPFSVGTVVVGGDSGDECLILQPLAYSFAASKGWLVGKLLFNPGAAGALGGAVEWIKPQQKKGASLDAFDLALEAVGSRYAAPHAGSSVLPGFSGGTLELSDGRALGADGAPVQKTLTLTAPATFRVTDPGTDRAHFSVDAATGSFHGTFFYPGAHQPTTFRGVLLQSEKGGAGFFVGPNGSGRVQILAAP